MQVERGVAPVSLHIDEQSVGNPQANPVRLTLRHLTEDEMVGELSVPVPAPGDFGINPGDEKDLQRNTTGKEGTEEVVHAKYVIGCDWARSWTREQVGIKLAGQSKDPQYGVVDITPISDFREFGSQLVLDMS